MTVPDQSRGDSLSAAQDQGPGRAFDSHGGFVEAVADALSAGHLPAARELTLVDPDFEGWPLDDLRVLDGLTAFARQPGRRLRLLARTWDAVQRQQPRFVAWRRTWGHVVDARVQPDDGPPLPACLIVDRRLAVCVDDREIWHGRILASAPAVYRRWESIDALLQRASPGFAQTTLGL